MLTLFVRPAYRVKYAGTTVELWISERKLPFFARSGGMVVPVAPDLRMIFGVAKMARDYSAGIIEREAKSAAPMQPGEAFVGSGAKFRYKYTALAVIFDEQKRTTPDLIARAVSNAIGKLYDRGARTLVLPDMTENLLAQPNWITAEQRMATARIAARAIIDAIRASRGMATTVRIWAWDPRNAPCYEAEMKRLEQQSSAGHTSHPAAAA